VIEMTEKHARFVQILVRGSNLLALDAEGTVWTLNEVARRWEPMTTERLQAK
jgi:hypothetical protein